MAYRFKTKESVAENVRRIVREEIDSAVSLLNQPDGRKRDEAVHGARKSIKKIRGLLRLLKPELGKTFRRENVHLRDTGRQLSVLRDAAALLETITRIQEQHGAALDRRVLMGVRKGLRDEKQQLEEQFERSKTIAQAASALRSLAKRLHRWPLKDNGFKAIAPGLRGTYQAGRQALRKAKKKQDAESYHSLRKRVKDHWYHVRLLEGVWTRVMQAHEASLKDLETWLGEDHNVDVLRQKLTANQERFGGEENVRIFLAVTGEYQKDLQEKSRSLAERVYSEKPRHFVNDIAALWHEWKNQPESMSEVEREARKPAAHPTAKRSAA